MFLQCGSMCCRPTGGMHACVCVCGSRGPGPPLPPGSSRSLMRLDELALRDMISAPPLSFFSSSTGLFFFFFSMPVTGVWWPERKSRQRTPRHIAHLNTHPPEHTHTHTWCNAHKMKLFLLPPVVFPLTHTNADRLALPHGFGYS